jgi:IclR family transcriptional regulator, acetate operon repressor
MNGRNPYPGTQAVVRAISLLKAFTDQQPEWRLTPLAETVGLNKATTFRLLTALESEGLVVRAPDSERYRLGPGLVMLGGRAIRANSLRVVARADLEVLAETTGETAALEALVGSEVLVLDEVAGSHIVTGAQYIGSRWPAHATSTGKAILAFLPRRQVEELLPGPLPAYLPNTISSTEALFVELALIRDQGYAVAREELEAGLVAIGAPVRNDEALVVAAVSVAGPAIRLAAPRVPEVAKLVCAAAARISANLGYHQASDELAAADAGMERDGSLKER